MPGKQPVIFGHDGTTVGLGAEEIEDIDPNAEVEVPDPNAEAAPDSESTEGEDPPAPTGKYRIGEHVFDTQEAALAFAQAETERADAYRQGVRDAALAPATPEKVTPAAEEEFNEEAYYADPKAFLKEYKKTIVNETLKTVDTTLSKRAADEQVWNEFSQRHPALADFQNDVERVTAANLNEVRSLATSKGIAAAYDFVAMKVRADFAKKAEALKPTRALPNGGGTTSSAGGSQRVTQKVSPKKPLSMAEQIRQTRGKRG